MSVRRLARSSAAVMVLTLLCPAAGSQSKTVANSTSPASAFLAGAEPELEAATEAANRADWVQATNITPDTDWLSSAARETLSSLSLRLAREAARFDGATVSGEERRKLDLLRRLTNVPPPADRLKSARLAQLQTKLASDFATGSFNYGGKATSLRQAEALLATTRDPEQARLLWEGWHDSAQRLKADYVGMVALSAEGARELGFADMGELWRSGYDRSPRDVETDLDKDWAVLKPLYDALHCLTRKRLSEHYGPSVQPRTGPIQAHLLGNMWSQNWGSIFDIVHPGKVERPDIDGLLGAAGYDPKRMVKTAEAFYTSLGFDPLPDSFWTSSQFVEPSGRSVDCNPSAWTIDTRTDVRIKMCIRVSRAQFRTVYHELGHDFYNLAYAKQPFLFRKGADEGFHEGIGDFIALSATTPENYRRIGVVPAGTPEGDDLAQLLQKALDEVPLLPFAVALDKWRWRVFAGEIAPDRYNPTWWALVREYQGMVPPRPRPEGGFDAGAKYHVPGNVAYISYLKARIYQYQFQRAACRMAKWQGPLHHCSIYGNPDVGARMRRMLALGGSRPNSEALASFTGDRDADPHAMLDYYRPVLRWLKKQNMGERCGW